MKLAKAGGSDGRAARNLIFSLKPSGVRWKRFIRPFFSLLQVLALVQRRLAANTAVAKSAITGTLTAVDYIADLATYLDSVKR